MANHSPTSSIRTFLPRYESQYYGEDFNIESQFTGGSATAGNLQQHQLTPAPGNTRAPNNPPPPLPSSSSSNSQSSLRPQSVAQTSVRSFASGSEGLSSGRLEAGNNNQHEPHPKPDPFVETLNHTVTLQQLCTRCMDNDALRALYLGQLITSLAQLLRKARELDALDLEEEEQQLKDIRNIVKKINGGQAIIQRQYLWKRSLALLQDMQNRLAEEHVASGLRALTRAINEVGATIRERSSTQ